MREEGIKLNFITYKQFLKQPKKIQKVLCEWWNPEIGDLFAYEYGEFKSVVECILDNETLETVKSSKGYSRFPLYSEAQLRNIIQNRTNFLVGSELTEKGYSIRFYDKEDHKLIQVDYPTEQFDLLKAYWQTVCGIIGGIERL